MKYLFLDESGDLGVNGSDYFVISILKLESPKDCKKLDKKIQKIRNGKFKKELKNVNEIKAYSSSKLLRIYLLKYVENMGFKSYSIIVNKRNPKNFRILESIEVSDIYMVVVIELLKKIEISDNFELRVDRFVLKKHENLFNKIVISSLSSDVHTGSEYKLSKIKHSYSEKWSAIQIVDFISWSIFQNFERKDNAYIKILKNTNKLFKYES
ncbi:MAG: DUF3800 domain-containing protein [Methanobacteriaceae archaeon]